MTYKKCPICGKLNQLGNVKCCGCKTYFSDFDITEVVEKGTTVNPDSKPPKQVGGSHYEQAIEPIEYIEANDLPFHEANVIKYVSRWRKKNGIEDLEKAKWYLDRLIELEKSENE